MSETLSPLNLDSPAEVHLDSVSKKADIHLEHYLLETHYAKLEEITKKTESSFNTLEERMKEISYLNELLRKIHKAQNDKGELNLTNDPELKALFASASVKNFQEDSSLKEKEPLTVGINKDKLKYSKAETENIIENIRSITHDLESKNQLGMQQAQRFMNEMNELYQLVRSVWKQLHDSKTKISSAIAR